MTNERARHTAPAREAESLRPVLDLLVGDMSPRPVDPATLPWDRPVFVLRSANMERMRAFLHEVLARTPTPDLHIMSHARDEETLRALSPCPFTFYPYPTPGRYRSQDVPPAVLDRLRAVDFGIVGCLDTGLSADLLDAVDGVLAAIRPGGGISFGPAGACLRLPERQARKRAEAAFFPLIEWYHGTLSSEEAV